MSVQASDLLREFIVRYARETLRFLTRKVGADEASDLAQEAILRVLRHAERETVAEPQALLRTTAVNLARDHVRRKRKESKLIVDDDSIGEVHDPTPSPSARIEAEQTAARFFEALDTLSPRCREVFMMRRFDELHQEEIARRLGISRNMVEKHLRTAVAKLKEALE